MNKNIKNNIFIFVFYLGLWLIIDIIDVKWFKIQGHKYELLITLGVVLISFTTINRKLFQTLAPFFRWLSIVILSAGLTSIWFFITITVLIKFHLSIGGNL